MLASGGATWPSPAASPREPLTLPSRVRTSRSSQGRGLAHAVLEGFCWPPGLQRCHRSHLPLLSHPLDLARTHLAGNVGTFRTEWRSRVWNRLVKITKSNGIPRRCQGFNIGAGHQLPGCLLGLVQHSQRHAPGPTHTRMVVSWMAGLGSYPFNTLRR